MTDFAQDFEVMGGDNAAPVFIVRDGSGNPIPLGGVTDIIWTARRSPTDAAVIVKKKSLDGVSFVTDGSDGEFQVLLVPADTVTLSGYFQHFAAVIDASGNISTVTIGRLQVGQQPTWSYSGDPSTSDRDAVRFLIQDTNEDSQQFTDPEIDYQLTRWTSPVSAAAQICRTLAARWAVKVDKAVGDLRISYSTVYKNYIDLAKQLDAQSAVSGLSLFSGSASRSLMDANAQNTDRTNQFEVGQFDNPSPPSQFDDNSDDAFVAEP